MKHENMPPAGDIHIKYLEPNLPPMDRELVYGSSVLRGRFLNQFMPEDGKWHRTSKFRREITAEDLQEARRIARLDEVDEWMISERQRIGPGRKLPPTLDQRIFVWLRDQGKCRYSSENVSLAYMEPDHYKPESFGGHTVTANLVCACKTCNRAKSQNDGEAFDRLAAHPRFIKYRDSLYKFYRHKMYLKEDIETANAIMYPEG